MHRVQMFTTGGRLLGFWVLPKAGNIQVWSPTQVRPVGSDYLYVPDVGENKIYKLSIIEVMTPN